MDAALSIALGYFVGSLSPSSLVGRVKKTDVRKSGTGNLGATNTMLVLGWGAGIFVMLFDLMKSFLSGKLAQYLFPGLSTAGMLACIGAMIGHCFPVFHRFRGGKGLATFGGLVIYCGLKYVPIVLCAGWAVMWIFDCTVMFPITVGIALPLLMYLFGEAPAKIITAICAGAVLERGIADARAQGRRGCVLTCKDKLVHYYEKFGFVNEGVSQSTHGGAVWYDMRLTF